MRARRQPAAIVAGVTPLVVGAAVLVVCLVFAVLAGVETIRDEGPTGWLLVIPVFGALPVAVAAGLVVAGWTAIWRGTTGPAVVGATAVLLAGLVAAANSQWLQPDLDFRTRTCGGERCYVLLGTAGLPEWNAQRAIALAAGAAAVVSLAAAIVALPTRAARTAVTVTVVAIAALVGKAPLDHADRSARHTRLSCARLLAYVELGSPDGPGHPTPTADMVERCRDPARHATDEGATDEG